MNCIFCNRPKLKHELWCPHRTSLIDQIYKEFLAKPSCGTGASAPQNHVMGFSYESARKAFDKAADDFLAGLAASVNTDEGIPHHELLCGHPEPEKKHGMKLVYVAGPYRAETREGVAQNVAAARHVGRLCVQKGWFPVLPTVNTAHFDHDFPGLADDQYWLDGTMELMRRCDAVVLVDGWQYSSGAKAEIEEARKMGLKVYMSSNVLPELAKVNA